MLLDLIMTARIQFERLSAGHIEAGWYDWVSKVDPSANTLFSRVPPGRDELLEIVSSLDSSNIWLAALLVEEEADYSTYFANVHIGPIDWIDRRCGFGRLIGSKQHRGKGYGTLLTSAILQYCFETLGMHKVFTHCSELNIGAHRSNLKAGMKQEATLYSDRYQSGYFRDTYVFAAWEDAWKIDA